jgi:hypothetical protein
MSSGGVHVRLRAAKRRDPDLAVRLNVAIESHIDAVSVAKQPKIANFRDCFNITKRMFRADPISL